MKKIAFLLMVITMVSKIIGFGREIALSYYYGTSGISDAYLIALTIPTIIFSFIGRGISTGYIPMYSKIEEAENSQRANYYTSNLINILFWMCFFISIVGMLFAEELVRLFASGFDTETMSLAVKFTRISIWGIFFTGLAFIFSGYLQIKNNYLIPALIGIPMSFFCILTIVLSSKITLSVLAIGIIIGTFSQVILLTPFAYRKGYRHKLVLNINDDYIKKMFYISLPIILGVAVDDINVLVDRTIASQIAEGGISALNYANRLNGFIQGIFVLSIATAIYPSMSKMAAANNMTGLKRSISEAITGINFLVLPSTIGSMIFAEEIVVLLFGRGAFDNNAILMTSHALFFYSIGMVAFGLRVILNRSFYSLQDTKTPMINATLAMILNILLNILLSRILGIGGLALATSLSALFCVFLMFITLRKKIGPFGMKQISISFLKILFASLVMGLLSKLSFNYLTASLSQNLSLLLAIGVGAVSYFVTIYFMKIEDVDVIVGAVKKKLGKGTAKG